MIRWEREEYEIEQHEGEKKSVRGWAFCVRTVRVRQVEGSR